MTNMKLSLAALTLTSVLSGCGMEQEQVGSESAAARWGNGLIPAALPTSAQETLGGLLLSYVTQCANDQGLAPGWTAGSAMSLTEERQVTSCVLSLVNKKGQSVTISQRGDAYSVDSAELADFPREEGAFFGNMFGEAPALFSCSADPDFEDANDGRVCTMTNESDESECAPMQALGACADICDVQSKSVDGVSYTTYTNCIGEDGVTYAQVTTTALN